MSYLEATHKVYKEAAITPDVGLCCTTNPIWELPGLKIPKIMQEMNYGCGSTVHARDLTNNPKVRPKPSCRALAVSMPMIGEMIKQIKLVTSKV